MGHRAYYAHTDTNNETTLVYVHWATYTDAHLGLALQGHTDLPARMREIMTAIATNDSYGFIEHHSAEEDATELLPGVPLAGGNPSRTPAKRQSENAARKEFEDFLQDGISVWYSDKEPNKITFAWRFDEVETWETTLEELQTQYVPNANGDVLLKLHGFGDVARAKANAKALEAAQSQS